MKKIETAIEIDFDFSVLNVQHMEKYHRIFFGLLADFTDWNEKIRALSFSGFSGPDLAEARAVGRLLNWFYDASGDKTKHINFESDQKSITFRYGHYYRILLWLADNVVYTPTTHKKKFSFFGIGK